MATGKKRQPGVVWIGLFLGLLALAGVVLVSPLAAASDLSANDIGAVVMQATPGGNTTPVAAPTPNSNPQSTAQPGTNVNTSPGQVTPASSDNSWLLWVILAIIVLAAIGGGAWYYPRRSGTVVKRSETDYIDDGPSI
jgi:hypothetical protein